jgi:hypothetical protein
MGLWGTAGRVGVMELNCNGSETMVRFLGWCVVCVAMTLSAGLVRAEVPPTADLPSIFNGRDATGWDTKEPQYWTVADGVLTGANDEEKKGSMLYTSQSYGDVIFECEVRFTGEIDSGVMMRKPEVQVQIGVSRSLKRDMTCSFYVGGYPEEAQAKRAGELLKEGDWNRLRVRAKGDTFTVWLNGEQVSQYTNAKFADPAPIGLQIHGGLVMKVEYRDIRALPLE